MCSIGWSGPKIAQRIGGVALAAKSKTKTKKRSTGVDQKLVKALSHQLRVEILAILNERMASPNELSKELEEGLSQVSYHVKVLKDFECIEMVKTEPRRGAVEHYYRATSRAYLTDRDWRALPESVKAGVSTSAFQAIVDDVSGAMEGGTFDSRDDRHVSWTPGVVDQQGWDESVDLVNKTLKQLMAIHGGSNKRLAKSGEEGIHVTTVLMNYEGLPPEARKAPKATKKRKAKKASRKKV
jgi:DNA-binding transcriptional ArsR family regulator